MSDIANAENFSFSPRPIPVPGDLRINWRIAVILLILRSSRSGKASLAKLYIVSDAVKSEKTRVHLTRLLAESLLPLEWVIRVEPALARAVDLLVGEGLARWSSVSGRMGIEATPVGVQLAEELQKIDDVLIRERGIISEISRPITEAKVTEILSRHGSY